MTRFVIDPAAAIRLAQDDVTVAAGHQLVAPNLLRSQALSILYRAVRAGEVDAADAKLWLERITTTKVRLLGDRVSRAVAWQLAEAHGWADTMDAEYLAVTRLQADAFVALDPELAARAEGVVPLAPFEALTRPD